MMFYTLTKSAISRLNAALAASVMGCVFALAPFDEGAAQAETAAVDPVLTVVAAPDAPEVVLDRAALEALPREVVRTKTIWTDGVTEFEGVSLHTLVQELGLNGDEMSFVALNDYAVTIPLVDAVEGGPILADTMNGVPMSVRDKGPLWVIYPFDANADYQAEQYYARSIWQLHRIQPTP